MSFAKNVFTIGFAPEFEEHIGLVDNSKNHALLQTKLSELGHPNSQIKFIKAEAPERRVNPIAATPANAPSAPAASPKATSTAAPKAAPSPAPTAKDRPAPMAFNKDDFKNDTLIQKALEIFKGTIVEVRG